MASEIRVNSFTNRSGTSTVSLTDTGAVISGIVTATNFSGKLNNNNYPSAGPLSNRNIMINGAMTVSQRSTSATGQTASAYGPCDRYRVLISNLGAYTIEQDTDAPTGFSNSLKVDCTTADASPDAGDFLLIRYIAEAQDLQQLDYGTSDAKELTMSFWVKSNKTGDASFMLNSPDGSDRAYITTYNIAAADTWEYKTISIPADTGGTINNDNGSGFEIEWWLNSGSTFTGTTPNAGWAARVNSARNNSNLGIAGSTDDYWQITGVQLEVGSVATPFEHRSYGDELAKCLRYFFKPDCEGSAKQGMMGMSYAANTYYIPLELPVPMRTAPSVVADGGAQWRSRTFNTNNFSVTWLIHGTATTTNVILNTSGGTINTGTPFWFETHSTSGCKLELNAEL